MGGWLTRLASGTPETRSVVHTIHLRAPMSELNYGDITHASSGFYSKQTVLAVDKGHAGWDGFINHVIDVFQLDETKIANCYWAAWVTRYRPAFTEEAGEHYAQTHRLLNQNTDSVVFAMYILDPDCEFYITLDQNAHSGVLGNSKAPIRSDSLLRPSERQ